MNKNEKQILRVFLNWNTPNDFYDNVKNITMVDSIYGLISRAYSGENISRQELDNYNIDAQNKKRIGEFVSKDIENLIFYNLMKTCLLILYKQIDN